MPNTNKLLSITNLKKYFPIAKSSIFQKEQLYVRANEDITIDIQNGETFARATPEQLAQIGKNADDIADIDAMIPSITSESNHLVNVSFLTNRLTSYRTSAAQDAMIQHLL